MLKKIILLLCPILIMSQKHTFQDELKRQYKDYLKIFNKVETAYSFETFVHNLNIIQDFNDENNGCKMYLTQHSDSFENEYIHKKCNT